jgi:hypothetical protein
MGMLEARRIGAYAETCRPLSISRCRAATSLRHFGDTNDGHHPSPIERHIHRQGPTQGLSGPIPNFPQQDRRSAVDHRDRGGHVACLFQHRHDLLDTEAFAFHRTVPFPAKSPPKTRLHHGTVYREPLRPSPFSVPENRPLTNACATPVGAGQNARAKEATFDELSFDPPPSVTRPARRRRW